MKLWLLENRKDLAKNNNPWEPWYDRTFGMVVRAETEEQARSIADEWGRAENDTLESVPDPWKDPAYSMCVELTADSGPSGLVMKDHFSS